MSDLLKNKSESKPTTISGGSGGMLSSDEMRKFIDGVEYIKQIGGIPIKLEIDIKSQINEVLSPFVSSVKESTKDIKDVQKNTMEAVEKKLPSLIVNAFEKADIKGKMEKSAQSISWENAILKVVAFLLTTCLAIYGLSALYMKIQEKWSGINNPMIAIALLIFCSYIAYIIGKAVGRNDKF